MYISDEEKSILLHSVREALNAYFDEEIKPSEINYDMYRQLTRRKTGAFVTLTIKGTLRGCVGYLVSNNTIYETVIDAAKQAAFNDPRFKPVTAGEVSKLDIEISILSPPLPINSYEEIRIGEHGLLLDDPVNRAVLLPQVAMEHNYTTGQFLSALCDKAGIERSAWVNRKLDIKVFTADIFSEVGKRKKTYERI